MTSKFKACSVAIFVVVIDVAVVMLVAVTVVVDDVVNGLTSKLKRITHGTIELSLLVTAQKELAFYYARILI
jgi:hypothetical protein